MRPEGLLQGHRDVGPDSSREGFENPVCRAGTLPRAALVAENYPVLFVDVYHESVTSIPITITTDAPARTQTRGFVGVTADPPLWLMKSG